MRAKTRSAPAPFAQVAPAEDILTVVESFAPTTAPAAVDARPQVVRFEDESGSWIARRLDVLEPAKSIEARHAWLAAVAKANPGKAPMPHPRRSAVVGDETAIEIVQYLPGGSWAANGRLILAGHGLKRPLPTPPDGMAALASLIAELHSGSAPKRTIPVLAMRDYLGQQRAEWKAISDYIARSGAKGVHIQRWQSASQRVVFAAWDVLEDAGMLDGPLGVPSHLNLWPGHVISANGRLGLIDWNRAAIAAPLIDVAQLVARFNGWTAASLEEVVESYMATRTLTSDERRLLPVFGALDLAIETGKVLAEAYVSDIDQTSQYAEMARSGAGSMLGSLESIGWSIRKTNMDSKELRREAKERARAVHEPGRKPRPKQLSSKRPKQ